MQYVILGLLMLHGPLTLYAVQRNFTQGVSLFYSASFGSIQRALRQLADRGLVAASAEPAGARGSKPYEITEAGAAEFREWMAAPIVGSDLETTALSKTFFLGLLSPAERESAIATISARIASDLGALEAVAASIDVAEIPPAASDVFAYQRATLEYGIRSHELARDWFAALPAHPPVRG